ncbi:MAG: hypothetical protein WC655_04235 [Candidatus Hydrogenedentales bacterium]|jgi:hypothetical protein
MRLCDDKTNNQVFNACILLTHENALHFVVCLENSLEMDPDDWEAHYHLFDLESRHVREIMFLPYEQSDAESSECPPLTLRLIKDYAGAVNNLGPELHPGHAEDAAKE